MTIPPAYTDITYFIEVAQTGNISRAAERLGITQPSLSSAMKRLEDSLGVTLFVRGRTGVQLTKSGAELVKKGRLLLLTWEQLKTDIGKKESGVSGQYIIGCHPSVALYSLSRFLPELVQRYPELEIKLTHDLSRKITENVISFEIDFGIVVNPIRHPDLIIIELWNDDVLCWTANKPSSTQTLDPVTGVLICDLNLIQVQKILGELQKRNQGFKRIVQSSNLEVITDLTASGVGIGVLPKRVATRISTQKLKPLDERLPYFRDEICLVYRADLQKTKGSQTIIDAIKKSVK
ncbi:MAG: LysR family transcriptional regulator [Oligoflexales bacterium]